MNTQHPHRTQEVDFDFDELAPKPTIVRSAPIDAVAKRKASVPSHYARRPRKVDHEETEAGHERWLLSYADFITLLMVLFMVLYAMQLVKTETIKADNARSTIEKIQEQPEEKTESRMSIASNPWEGELQTMVAKGNIRWSQDNRGVEINVNAGTLFDSGEAKLRPQSYAVLNDVAQVLRHWQNNRILVEGHTDSVPISTEKFESNWELSSARAGAVVRYLIDCGIAPHRLAAMGRADNVPASLGDTPADYAKNRRVTILVQY